ncbi:MAG: hypothetical protein KIT11_01215 [Fimbriimonadaceae bacterium]|nr:hypothetical protein [Fimbriimonadaceae bacterium]QYK55006.1 MAG: hypothetical protein KF733_08320 [Fimbriimonadaceae bacterium]
MLATLMLLACQAADVPFVFRAPADKEYAKVVPGGTTILPNGRLLTPSGRRLYTGPDVWQTLLSRDGKTLVAFAENELSVYRVDEPKPQRRAVALKELAPAGVFSPDGTVLLASRGDAGKVAVLSTADWSVKSEWDVNAGTYGRYIVDMAYSRDGRYVFALDVARQEVLTLDSTSGKIVSQVDGGRQPYALALSGDGKKLFVANIGLFDYSKIPTTNDPEFEKAGLTRPAFAYPSEEATKGVQFEGRFVPGLGEDGAPGAQSVYRFDVSTPTAPKFELHAKCGTMIRGITEGGIAVGGSAPNALLLQGGLLYVSNANNDTVQVFDAASMKTVKNIRLSPIPEVNALRGVIPSGMAMDRAGKTLYVCASGLNAVVVIDPKKGEVKGMLPTGWFPMQLRLNADETKLYVACQKGLGRGPRGPKHPRPESDERHGLSDMPGMVLETEVPSTSSLPKLTAQVLKNNGLVNVYDADRENAPSPIPTQPGQRSKQIKHVVFITKENHTFDGIFGGLKGAKGEPDYAEFGMEGWITEKGKGERLPIMPNHTRLAEQFAISDNFYMEPQASGDGHRWLIGVYPSLWTTRQYYAGWNFRADDATKGRLPGIGSDGSQIPEDFLENGSMWEHFERGGISFRNYGEGFEFPGQIEPGNPPKTGSVLQVNHPLNKALWDSTCWEYPVYNTNIPDIARVEWLKEDVEKNFRAKGKPLPQFINITLCNDHGDGKRPEWGYPYVCSYMADNDLALGRLVEWLSQQPEWENMAVFVTQDDSGGDNDHVDRHRSFVLVLGPYAKRGYISRDHTSIMSIHKTIYQIFGLGPNNMFDALATDLRDMFTVEPNLTGYSHVDSDPRVFQAELAYKPGDPRFKDRKWMPAQTKMDDPDFMEWMNKRGLKDDDD